MQEGKLVAVAIVVVGCSSFYCSAGHCQYQLVPSKFEFIPVSLSMSVMAAKMLILKIIDVKLLSNHLIRLRHPGDSALKQCLSLEFLCKSILACGYEKSESSFLSTTKHIVSLFLILIISSLKYRFYQTRYGCASCIQPCPQLSYETFNLYSGKGESLIEQSYYII